MRRRVAVIALESIRNIGEAILAEATEFLIRRACPDVEISRVQFCPGGRGETLTQRGRNFLFRRIRWAACRTRGDISFRLLDLAYRIRLNAHFRCALRPVDSAILAVGMFKYASQDFSYLYDHVARISSHLGCQLMLSATSVAEANAGDWRFRQLVRALCEKSWRMVTTRDGERGVRLLRDGYGLASSVGTRVVGDPALWLPELTGVVCTAPVERRFVGVNLVRGGIYETYRGGVTEERLLAVYCDLLAELDARGIVWRLFSNGTKSDERFGDLLCARLGISAEQRLPPPTSVADFARTIVSFKAVFGARLHACLTAVAFRVPSVWLDWDDKFVRVAEELGYTENLLEPEDLSGLKIVDRLEESMERGFDETRIGALKEATAEAIAEFLRLRGTGRYGR